MNCLTARKILLVEPSPFSGGENLRAKQHVADCQECRSFFAREEQLREVIQTKVPRTPAPPTLREAILSAVARERRRASSRKLDVLRRIRPWRSALSAAAVVTALLIFYLSSPWHRNDVQRTDSVVNTLIQDHLAIKLKEHPLDLETSDKTQLEQWLATRVDFNVKVPQFKDSKLEGGHLCLIGGKRSVSLSFQKDDFPFTLYIIDRSVIDLAPLEPFASINDRSVFHGDAKGCNIILWAEKGLVYGLVSDLSVQDLLGLVSQSS